MTGATRRRRGWQDGLEASRLLGVMCVSALLVIGNEASAQTAAQSPATSAEPTLTLERALEIAEARSEGIAEARAGMRSAEGTALQARSRLFPQLSATGGYQRTLASEFSNVFDTGNAPSCPSFASNPLAPLADRVAEIERAIDCGAIAGGLFGGSSRTSLPFGRTNVWQLNLSFSQNLYSGGRIGAQTMLARTGGETAALTFASTRAQLLFDVTQAYYDAVLSAQLVSIAEATVRQSEATLANTRAAFNVGSQPEFEVLRASVTRDNGIPDLIRQRADRAIAQLRLKQLLDLPPESELQLPDLLSSDTLPAPAAFADRVANVEAALRTAPESPQPATIAALPLPDRTPVQQASTAVRAQVAALEAAKAERMPSISLTSGYGRVAYPGNVWPGFSDFRTNWSVGVTAQVPILTGGNLRGGQIAAEANLDAARSRLQQTSELAALDTRSAWAELLAARAAWDATSGTIEQASRAYQIAEVRYQSGVSTQTELADSRLQQQQASVNRAIAARNLQLARARVALLPNLPLGGTPATTPTPAPTTTPGIPAPNGVNPSAPGQTTSPQLTTVSTGASGPAVNGGSR